MPTLDAAREITTRSKDYVGKDYFNSYLVVHIQYFRNSIRSSEVKAYFLEFFCELSTPMFNGSRIEVSNHQDFVS